jgi:hypothetical protein
MIINVAHKKKNQITVDIRCNQIRYVHDVQGHGKIEFNDISQTTSECYQYLFENNKDSFLESLAEEMSDFLMKGINTKDLVIV